MFVDHQKNFSIMANERISLNDSTIAAVTKMSDGNPGAAVTMMEMLKEGRKIDPDGFAGGLGFILLLDTYGIYGSDIYILNNDICDRKINKTCAVLRACQLGLFSSNTLKDACSRQDRSGKKMIPVEELYLKVKEQLPNFDNAELTVS
jgi:hypothetical protein